MALAALDPVVNVFVDHRARTTHLEPRWLGGELWGHFVDGRLVAACHVGANLVPVGASVRGRRGSSPSVPSSGAARSRSIVGPHDAVAAFWACVEDVWGRRARHAASSRT